MVSTEEKFKRLPPELRAEVEDFIDFLLTKTSNRRKKRASLDWMGGLKKYRDQYTSLELQELASKWRD